ncbi:MAG: 4Fe-4S dicluster domain-containing protein [Sandaracinaceae bacterium]|nr:4Fe-4S dicluster domain-containing protein [Sandaracinaceae bacterium]
MQFLERAALDALFDALRAEGRAVLGPTVVDGAIRLAPIDGAQDLPAGWTDAQGPGHYRLRRGGDATFDGYVVGPDSLKQVFFPSKETLYRAERRADGKLGFSPVLPDPGASAVLGVRACDLAAARIQRAALEGGPYAEPRHRARREAALIVAVNCTRPGALCFCASTETGPRVTEGADLVLTERPDGFLVEAPTQAGRAVLARLDTRPAAADEVAWVDDAMREAAANMGREVDLDGLPEQLFGRLDHARWKIVAERCLACGNCTSVCPTCFCSTSEHPSSIDGDEASRVRLWDSCFTEEHAYIHGGGFRPRTEDRYRQWLTHKVGAWVAQFGTSGCVGCGRCIAWCPVGIDLTEEIAALRQGEGIAALPAPPAHACATDEDLVPRAATVTRVERESDDVVTLHVAVDEGLQGVLPGRFCQVSLPGIGEVPISISGGDGALLEHTIRAVGRATDALCALSPGDAVGIRGPYGRAWPLEALAGRPVVVVAGGIGLAPLRGALRSMIARPDEFPEVHLCYGARSPADVLYAKELLGWMEVPTMHLHLTVDHASPAWLGHVGVVTRLLDARSVPAGASAMICGPEIMMRFTVERLAQLGVPDERTWVTMERNMQCATGFCGRCQYGPYFVCKDGPVFSFDQIRFLFGEEGY